LEKSATRSSAHWKLQGGSGFQPLARGRMPLPLFQTLEKRKADPNSSAFCVFRTTIRRFLVFQTRFHHSKFLVRYSKFSCGSAALGVPWLESDPLSDDAFEFVDGNADLLQGVAVAQ
jgi:hypothetical protein